MGVNFELSAAPSFYPHPNPPPARGRGRVSLLSFSVTGSGTGCALQFLHYHFQHSIQILQHLIVPEAHYLPALFVQIPASGVIVCFPGPGAVRHPVRSPAFFPHTQSPQYKRLSHAGAGSGSLQVVFPASRSKACAQHRSSHCAAAELLQLLSEEPFSCPASKPALLIVSFPLTGGRRGMGVNFELSAAPSFYPHPNPPP